MSGADIALLILRLAARVGVVFGAVLLTACALVVIVALLTILAAASLAP